MRATLADIRDMLGAEVLTHGGDLDRAVVGVQGCDLMSDVLAFSKPESLLLTGLINPQVVRTAEVAGMLGVVFVRGKRPDPAVVELAQEFGLPLMVTEHSMFDACGTLHGRGLRGVDYRDPE